MRVDEHYLNATKGTKVTKTFSIHFVLFVPFVALFQACTVRNVFGERGEHGAAFITVGSSDDHSLRLESAQFAWLQISDDNNLATD
jgi:hypothetical protein